jgi:uncharacterized protein YgiM (DUF1202 family)
MIRLLSPTFFEDIFWGWENCGDSIKFSEMFELKPEYKKKQLQSEINNLERNVKTLTSLLTESQEKLNKKKEELDNIK